MDQRTLDLQLAKFEALKNNIPPSIREEFVNEYNNLVISLSQATGENLSQFEIQPAEIKHKVLGTRPAGYTGGGRHVTYSSDKYCDESLFNRRLESLSHYLDARGIRRGGGPTQPASQYDALTDDQLAEIMVQRHIKPKRVVTAKGEGWVFDRAHAISEILQQDSQPPALTSQQSTRPSERQRSNYYFVAHEFSASGLDDLRTAIKEALSSSGLEPYFADKEIVEGQIFIDKILPKIRNCRFGIYDISNPAKPNVFIELGAAIAIGARYYIVVREGVPVPSDLQGLDRIEYRSFEHLKSQLREKIKE